MKLPSIPGTLLRTAGLFVSAFLALSPWILTFDSIDPNLNQGWITFGLALISLSVMAVLLPFYSPRTSQLPYLVPAIFLWVILAVGTLVSRYYSSLHECFIIVSQIILFIFLRMSLQRRDISAFAYILGISGTFLAIFARFLPRGEVTSAAGLLNEIAVNLANPGVFGPYVLATSLLTLGLLRNPPHAFSQEKVSENSLLNSSFRQVVLCLLFLIQIGGLALANSKFLTVCFFIGVFFIFSDELLIRGKRFPGKMLYFNGAVLAIVITMFFGGVFLAAHWYSLETIPKAPHFSFPLISRLIHIQMGFSLFLDHPLIGSGLSGSRYLLTGKRPLHGTFLGLENYIASPKSSIVRYLSETGFFGILGFSLIFACTMGIHGWKKLRESSEENAENPGECFGNPLPGGEPGWVDPSPTGARGECFGNPSIFLMPVLSLLFLGVFDDRLSSTSLSSLIILLLSLHQSACLRDVQWKRRFSPLFMLYFALPPLMAVSGWQLMANHQAESILLFEGKQLLEKRDFSGAWSAIEGAIRANPQSIDGLHSLAKTMEGRGLKRKVNEALTLLDSFAPNAFGLKFRMAQNLFSEGMILEAHKWALRNLAWCRSPQSCELLAKILEQEGRIEEAEKAHHEAVEHVPDWLEDEVSAANRSRLWLAAASIERNQLYEASEFLGAFTETKPEPGEFFYLKGLLEYKKQNASAAFDFFEKSIKADPEQPKYANALGFHLTQNNMDLDRAQSLLEGAYQKIRLRNNPLLADILGITHSLGLLYWKQGQTVKAGELLFIASTQTPQKWGEIKTARENDYQKFLISTRKEKNPEQQR